MKCVSYFDENRDIMSTIPGLDIDLDKAIESGVVLDTGTVDSYNDLDDVHSIGHRVSSVFEALDIQRKILASGNVKGSTVAQKATVNPTGESGV